MNKQTHPVPRRCTCTPLAALAIAALTLALGTTARLEAQVGAEVDAEVDIVFVSRSVDGLEEKKTGADTVAVRSGQGSLVFRAANGDERVLVDGAAAGDGTPADVMDPDVSWDARGIVFSGFSRSEGAWRIWRINVDGTGLEQITRSDRDMDLSRYGEAAATLERYDDLDPCWLPDGRICLVSTRYPGIAPDNRARATNLYVVDADGSDLHRITTERFGGDTPVVDPVTGNIVYSRWWRTPAGAASETGEPTPIEPGSPGYGGGSGGFVTEFDEEVLLAVSEDEFPGVNSWFLASIRPDGGDMKMLSGFHLDRAATQAYRPSPTADGRFLALFIPETPHIGLPGRNGLRLYNRGPSRPIPLGGPQSFGELEAFDEEFPNGLPGDGREIPPDADVAFHFTLYSSAVELPTNDILVSARLPGSNDADLYIRPGFSNRNGGIVGDPAGALRRPLVVREGTHELDATPVVRRNRPPVVEDRGDVRMAEESPRTAAEAYARGGSFTFVVENIHGNAPIDVGIPNAPPIGQDLSIEFWMSPPGSSMEAIDEPVLVHSEPIPADGRVEVELPAGVPLFEVLRLPRGEIARGRDGQIFHVGGMNFGRAGEEGRCVGCHAGHSMQEVPEDFAWTNVAPSAFVTGTGLNAENPDFPPELFEEFGGFFRPERVVDRSTEPFSHWAANVSEQGKAELAMEWGTPIQAKTILLVGAEPFLEPFMLPGMAFEFDYEIELKLGETRVGTISSDGSRLLPHERVRMAVNPEIEFDSLGITFTAERFDPDMSNFGASLLSEVEIIGRPAPTDPGDMQRYPRGDVNADTRVNISDPIVLLAFLFQGGDSPACAAAADAEHNGELDVTDAVRMLGWLFQGMPRPEPFGACENVRDEGLDCETQVCDDN